MHLKEPRGIEHTILFELYTNIHIFGWRMNNLDGYVLIQMRTNIRYVLASAMGVLVRYLETCGFFY